MRGPVTSAFPVLLAAGCALALVSGAAAAVLGVLERADRLHPGELRPPGRCGPPSEGRARNEAPDPAQRGAPAHVRPGASRRRVVGNGRGAGPMRGRGSGDLPGDGDPGRARPVRRQPGVARDRRSSARRARPSCWRPPGSSASGRSASWTTWTARSTGSTRRRRPRGSPATCAGSGPTSSSRSARRAPTAIPTTSRSAS